MSCYTLENMKLNIDTSDSVQKNTNNILQIQKNSIPLQRF